MGCIILQAGGVTFLMLPEPLLCSTNFFLGICLQAAGKLNGLYSYGCEHDHPQIKSSLKFVTQKHGTHS